MKDLFNKIKEIVKKNKLIKMILYGFIVYVCLVVLFYPYTKMTDSSIKEISYTEYQKLLKDKKIDTIYYSASEEYMIITLLNDDTKDMTKEERKEYQYTNEDKRRVLYPAYDEFRKDVIETDTNLEVMTSKDTISSIISTSVSLLIPILWIYLLYRVFKGQIKGVKKEDVVQNSDVRFSDVIGHEEILDDIKLITDLIKHPDKGKKVGAKVSRGILLSGDPGTGKTLIAKAIAGEAGVPFLYQNASSFIEMYVGLGAKRVRDLFKIAKENSPCIIFIDEIDAIGNDRDSKHNNSENEQTINALLQEMDGFTDRDGVFVIAATNKPDKLDKALVRSGRFDRQIVVAPPKDWKTRFKLFEHYLHKFKVDKDIDVENISKQTTGFTGADIATVCNEASMIAVMHDKDAIDEDCIEEAIDKKIFKGNRTKKDFDKDKQIVAYHEAGHTVAHYLLGESIARATIIGTTSGVGGVVFGEDLDTQFRTKNYYENRIMICYAGRASEELKFDSVTQGASSDIQQATQLLYEYVSKLGFDKEFGLLDLDTLMQSQIIDKTNSFELMQKKSKELYEKTVDLLRENYDKVELIAQKLLEVEVLSGSEIEELLS